jgi:acetyl-CoA carboxylase biotin carboxyl carrier protein
MTQIMDIRKIRKLIELVKQTGVGEIEVKSADESVRISCNAPAAAPAVQHVAIPAAAATPAESTGAVPPQSSEEVITGHKINSPMVGTVYLASTPGDAPFVEVGQHVNVGDTLCLIEAMKMFNKIEADKAGIISARRINNQQAVEFDQELFIIETDD